MAKLLGETGLAYFWGKIRAYIDSKVGKLENNFNGTAIVDNASGSIVEINDGANNVSMKSLLANIDYNANGYEGINVFVGDGKNYLDMIWLPSSMALFGLTYTENDDGSYTVSGTANQQGNIAYCVVTLPAGTYILSGCPYGGNRDTYFIQDSTAHFDANTGGTPSTVTLTDDTQVIIYVTVRNGATLNNVTFQPMIRESSKSEEYESYKGYLHRVDFENMVYGGSVDLISGELISEYNSDGSHKSTPVTEQIVPEEISTFYGYNKFSASSGNVNIEYVADPKLYIDKIISLNN